VHLTTAVDQKTHALQILHYGTIPINIYFLMPIRFNHNFLRYLSFKVFCYSIAQSQDETESRSAIPECYLRLYALSIADFSFRGVTFVFSTSFKFRAIGTLEMKRT
jgi:hypothetical protein